MAEEERLSLALMLALLEGGTWVSDAGNAAFAKVVQASERVSGSFK